MGVKGRTTLADRMWRTCWIKERRDRGRRTCWVIRMKCIFWSNGSKGKDYCCGQNVEDMLDQGKEGQGEEDMLGD